MIRFGFVLIGALLLPIGEGSIEQSGRALSSLKAEAVCDISEVGLPDAPVAGLQLCCCPTITGVPCCNFVSECGRFVPGCACR